MVLDINLGTGSSSPTGYTVSGGKLYFSAATAEFSSELWTILNAVVPLNLLKFTGSIQGKDALLQWQTSSEINSSHFEIESSIDGSLFHKINQVTANNTPGNNSYQAIDNNPFTMSRTVFYRLKIVDRDGESEFSNIIKLSTNQGGQLSVFPNPSREMITISGLNQKGQVRIYDVSGRLIKQQLVTAQAMILGMPEQPGFYILQYWDGDKKMGDQKIIRLK